MGNICFKEEFVQNDFVKLKFDEDDLQATSIQIEGREAKQKVKLSDFKKLKPLGQGAYGKVMLVEYYKNGIQKLYAMKILEKKNIKKESQIRHVFDERKILEKTDSNFVVKLRYAFQNHARLYFIVDYMAGGDFYYHIKSQPSVPDHFIKFYSAEIIFGLQHLHSLNVIYRDLKPENILVSESRHIKLSDFGLSKILENDNEKAKTCCGTIDYLAPEVLVNDGYTFTCDFYSLGCLIYEMYFGKPPFYSKDKKQMMENRIIRLVPFLELCSKEARDLLTKLLEVDPKKRLGRKGAQQILDHAFFKELDIKKMKDLQIEPPITLIQSNKVDQKIFKEKIPKTQSKKENLKIFEGFTYFQKESQDN
ncbi:unnamed protein product (macronuclear) [Paramecium tetraurelia]|uniref:Protein kinase domain-containing protein n=1 Tax=Paramecium tetraurelia TaxID=5888 RepID=A0DPR8_PARTE|nr:uncharacterized protein GSPATT00019217001 [Paramecium tetraurelia]CAK85035.1 unnamed protein product [Paramecium tetraurelia]|eukprot:XP_001452432.1 hypothetical protein (macronuclear) [Paramecium tetraurelia strain d4-2]